VYSNGSGGLLTRVTKAHLKRGTYEKRTLQSLSEKKE